MTNGSWPVEIRHPCFDREHNKPVTMKMAQCQSNHVVGIKLITSCWVDTQILEGGAATSRACVKA